MVKAETLNQEKNIEKESGFMKVKKMNTSINSVLNEIIPNRKQLDLVEKKD